MIRVNLLRNLGSTVSAGTTAFQGASITVSQDMQKQALYRIVVIAAIVGLLIGYEKIQLSSKQSELEDVEAKISGIMSEKATFGDAGPIVEQYEKQEAKLKKQMKVLEALTENRLREVKLLDAVQTIMPPKAWLEKLIMDEGRVVMTGFAPNEANVSELYRALESNVLFSNVRVKSEAKDDKEIGSVQRFDFTFQAGKVK